jgi:large subunit ribosomal protein L13
MRTLSPKTSILKRDWHLFDANDQVLGRLSTAIAHILMGKHKTDFARHLDMADHIVVINAAKIVLTGNKETKKVYHRHSGYPGGFRSTTLAKMRETKPENILIHAVSGMLPKNKLQDRVLKHLHIYPGSQHPYSQHFSKISPTHG